MDSNRKSLPPERLTSKYWLTFEEDRVIPVRIFRGALEAHVGVHWHEFYELSLILDGAGTHILNGNAFPLRRGSIFLLTPADFHEVIPDRGDYVEMYNLIFLAEALDERLSSTLFGEAQALTATFPERIMVPMEAEFRCVQSELKDRRSWHDFVVRGSLEHILINLVRQESGTENIGRMRSDVESDEIRRALIYISHNFREKLTLQRVARQVHLSPNYFSERFRKGTGFTFQNYLKKTRLGFARSLLFASNIPVSEVCQASGFSTLSHFERAFKREFGCTPSSCRD